MRVGFVEAVMFFLLLFNVFFLTFDGLCGGDFGTILMLKWCVDVWFE